MKQLLLFLTIISSQFVYSQDCNLTISGKLLNKNDQSELAFATVYVEETKKGNVATASGYYILKDLCPGKYTLRISHINCETKTIKVDLVKNTEINFSLDHNTELLTEVVIKGGSSNESLINTRDHINSEEIGKDNGKSLSEMISNISGVSTLKTGSGVSKPVIHGLSGNRVAVLNNGIVQAGQQWGNDHAPEIDPNSMNQITVIKGVGAIEYGGNALGGVILVEPGVIPKAAHYTGSVNYVHDTNGKGHTVSSRLENASKLLNWRVSGTIKKFGDRETPNYFLNNTGVTENNFAIQLDKEIQDHWNFNVYYSMFNTEIGILRGSHIGNTTDLEAAIEREEPFFTEENFSYQIDPPKQKVQHHLLKLSSKYFLDSNTYFSVTYGGQLNDRKEFDVRRGGRSHLPALSLQLFSHYIDAAYSVSKSDRSFKIGIQGRANDNTNNPETGILPLIPDYNLYNAGIFSFYQREIGNWGFEIGGRYDFVKLKVATITRTIPREIERFNHNYNNYALETGFKYDNGTNLLSKFNIGIAQRSPEVNELHSYGLHQGVSGVEIGNPDMNQENSFKAIWSNEVNLNNKLSLEGSVYFQSIKDFIFLELQSDFELTRRGAFLKYIYKQTEKATIKGADLIVNYQPNDQIEINGKYSVVRGQDEISNTPLVFMPSDNFSSSVTYKLKNTSKFHDTGFTINSQYIFRQRNWSENQDILSPPDSYILLGASFQSKLMLNNNSLRLMVSVENLLDTKYREYLNRLRYFADETGRNVRIGLMFRF